MPDFKHKYRLVIFDWDGTLVDSTQRIVDSMRKAGQEVGLPAVPDSAIQNIIGLGLPEALRTVWPSIKDSQLETMRAVYARFFVAESHVAMGFFDGAESLLNSLLSEGRLLAVATGKSRKGLNRILQDLKVGHLFATTRCADETRSKPDPLMLNEILTELSVTPAETLMIGDTTYDLDMANTAGIDTVAMGHGAHDDSTLLACGPKAICHSIQELKNWIEMNG